MIVVENVVEFQGWGPLDANDRPDAERKGETFNQWVRALRSKGYSVQWRELAACDYGAPTIRKRLFIIARCDGKPIVWPRPTHGPGRQYPHRAAAEIIDWSIPVHSIFLDKEQGKAVGVKRPLGPGNHGPHRQGREALRAGCWRSLHRLDSEHWNDRSGKLCVAYHRPAANADIVWVICAGRSNIDLRSARRALPGSARPAAHDHRQRRHSSIGYRTPHQARMDMTIKLAA